MPYPSSGPNIFEQYIDNPTASGDLLNGLRNALYLDSTFEHTNRQYRPYLPANSGGDNEWEDSRGSEQKIELHDRFAYGDLWNTNPKSLTSMDDIYVDFSTGSSWRGGFLVQILLGTILSIDQIVGTNLYTSTVLASNKPTSILKPQFNVSQGVNTYPRLTDIVNPDTIYGSQNKNPLSSSEEYFSYDTLIFSNYIHYNIVNFTMQGNRRTGNFNVRGNLTPFVVLDDSPIQRKNRQDDSTVIVTYSPYSLATQVDFQNDRTWINSFFSNDFYWIW